MSETETGEFVVAPAEESILVANASKRFAVTTVSTTLILLLDETLTRSFGGLLTLLSTC